MVLNYIWIAFFVIAFVIALVRLIFFGDTSVFPAMMDSTFAESKNAFDICIGLTGALSRWLGIMKIGERGGVVNALSRLYLNHILDMKLYIFRELIYLYYQ